MSRTLFAGILTSLIVSVAAAEPQHGFTVPSWFRGQLATGAADRALSDANRLEANWTCLIVPAYVEDPSDPKLDWSTPKTPSDADLTHAIETAHRLGLKVMLSLHLEPRRGGWKGEIGRGFSARDWQEFFSRYEAFLRHYAALADELGCEQFCLGNELGNTVSRESEWRGLARVARATFDGSLTYAANHDEVARVKWWDALDLIGIDAYYELTRSDAPTIDMLVDAWERRAEELESLAERWQRQIVFTEIGYRSWDGTNRRPWAWGPDYQGPVDTAEQADCFEALLGTLLDRPWFAGLFIWALTPGERGGHADDGYTPLGKPAADVIQRHFRASQASQPVQAGALGDGWQDWSYRANVTPRAAQGAYGEDALVAELEAGGALSLSHRSSPGQADEVSLTVRAERSVRLTIEIDGDPVELGRLSSGRWKTFRAPIEGRAQRLTVSADGATRLEITHLQLIDLPEDVGPIRKKPGSSRGNPFGFFEDLFRGLWGGLSFW